MPLEENGLYKLEYLPLARRDMIEVVRYISRELDNPMAAKQLARELTEAGDNLLNFPYANPAYVPIRPLKREYRRIKIHNYIMFYWVDEGKKLVTIARVIYGRRNYERLLD